MEEKVLTVLVKPASSKCNLRCSYCFYADESKNREVSDYGLMSYETMKVLIDRIAEYLDGKGRANISFQGGEPTLAGLLFFHDFVTLMARFKDIKTSYSIQTNATLLNDEWIAFFKEHAFLVGVSLDGYESNMDAFRMDKEGKSVFYKVLNNIEKLEKAQVEYNILTVVTRKLASHPKALLNFYLEHDMNYVQLIPCLDTGEAEDDGMSLTPEAYETFYRGFFEAWEKAYLKGKIVHVSLFENLTAMLKGYLPFQCGMIGRCALQYVVEADGTIFPCDFYCLDAYKMGDLKHLSFEQMADSVGAKKLFQGQYCETEVCFDCPYRGICHGACQRQNSCFLNKKHCAYQKVLDQIVPGLEKYI